MKVIETDFEGLFIVEHRIFKDDRGVFVKTYNAEAFKHFNINLEISERYFSVSKKNVIRGMHFQTPPKDHTKLVTVISGKILDVVLDLRKGSNTFGKYFSKELDNNNYKTIIIPKGFAHGFKAMENNTIVEYNQSTCYSLKNDDGIRFDSFGFDWKVVKPIVSKRDLSFHPFGEYKSPFE